MVHFILYIQERDRLCDHAPNHAVGSKRNLWHVRHEHFYMRQGSEVQIRYKTVHKILINAWYEAGNAMICHIVRGQNLEWHNAPSVDAPPTAFWYLTVLLIVILITFFLVFLHGTITVQNLKLTKPSVQ